MREAVTPWDCERPLSSLALWVDWDPVASMVLSLRIHLYEHGTIPTWNFKFEIAFRM